MKKIGIKILKTIGILVLLLAVVIGIVAYTSIHYKMYDLKPDRSKFPEITDNSTPADFEKLAEKLVAQMTFEEKVDQMYGEKMWQAPKMLFNFFIKQRFPHIYVGGNERLNIPPWVLSDGPRGARVMDKDVSAVTTFPVAMSRGASWDTSLEARINEAIAMEMRANKTNYAATPCINLLRNPGWGRAQETYGEDPWLLGEFGVAAVQAIQKHNVMACPKHFALNSIENSRWVVDVHLDDRTLQEVYLPHFKKVVQEGKTASIMSAYNSVLGEPCGQNKLLLNDILRKEWGFEGFVSTDWVMGTYDAVKSIKAGLNVEMPWQDEYSYKDLKKAISEGKITEADIDKLVIQTLKTRLQYAFKKDIMDYNSSVIATKEHIDLAREAAEKGMVLLKNDGVLPFNKNQDKKIAVIGRLADMENTGDKGSSNSTAPYVITPFKGISNFNDRLNNNQNQGDNKLGNVITLNKGDDMAAAQKLAKESDEVVLVVGYTAEDEGEYMITSRDAMVKSSKANKLVGDRFGGGDRENLRLNPKDEELIQAVAGTNKNLVVVYVGGSAVDMSAWKDKVPAILFAWYGGMEGGNALANILYGVANPSGKLPFSIAQNVKDYPYFNPYTEKTTYEYYHGYTLFEKKNLSVAYPFGFGLSYTQYNFTNLKVINPNLGENDSLRVSVNLTNSGKMDGEEVAQVYIGFKNSKVDRPVKLLRGFKKVFLKAGETKTVQLAVAAKDLAWYNPNVKQWEIEKMPYEVYVGSSSAANDLLKGTFSMGK